MQDLEAASFQLIEHRVAFPPVLIKAELQSLNTHGASHSSSSTLGLRLEAIRFLNGKQEIVTLKLGGETDVERDVFVDVVSGKKGLNLHLSADDCCKEVAQRLKDRRFTTRFDKASSTLDITFEDFKNLLVEFDFGNDAKRSPVTAPFVLAFEAACSFSKIIQSAQAAAEKASEELKQKERDLRQAEKRANNLTADLSVEKQRFQRLLTSGGSSLEDVLSPKGAGKAARRSASMLMDGSMVLGSNPNSPRKKRKAADAVLIKAGRTAQKKTKEGFIDSDEDEDDNDEDESESSTARTTSKADGSKGKLKTTDRSSSSDTRASSAAPVEPTSAKSKKNGKSAKSAEKKKSTVEEVPSLNARRTVRSAKKKQTGPFVDSEEEDGNDTEKQQSGSTGSGKGKNDSKAIGVDGSDTEKTESDDEVADKRRKK